MCNCIRAFFWFYSKLTFRYRTGRYRRNWNFVYGPQIKLFSLILSHFHRIYKYITGLWMTTKKMHLFWIIYLFIPSQLYMFRAMSSPIIRSIWLYLQLLILSTGIAAGWCHGWDGTGTVPSHPWHQLAAISVDNIRSCKYSQMLLMMGEDIVRNV